MFFILPDNPCLRQPPKPILKTYEEEGRKFKETGEFRQAKKGEFVLGFLGMIAEVRSELSEDKYHILKEVK